jgi:exodeoxyribonuclease VII small subunit
MAKSQGSFEKGLERLRGIVDRLERGDLPLEQALALFREGLTLVQSCGKQLESARNEVKVVAEGLLREFEALEPLDSGGEDSGDER